MSTTNDSDNEQKPHLKAVKSPRTEKHEIVLDAILEHAIVFESGQLDVVPALEHLREEYGNDYTTKSYLWQIAGEFTAPVYPDTGSNFENEVEIYRAAVADVQSDSFTAGVEWGREHC